MMKTVKFLWAKRESVARAALIALGVYCGCLFLAEQQVFAGGAAHTWCWTIRYHLIILGFLILCVGFLWSRGKDWLTWIHGMVGNGTRASGCVVLAIAVISILFGAHCWIGYGPILISIFAGVGCFLVLLEPTEDSVLKNDAFHRSHIVQRLGELLCDTPANIRRIGILGEWGTGKTHLMKLLQAYLISNANGKFRMAWVNPWRSQSHADAWKEIARAFDNALGFPRLLPQSILAIPGLGAVLELLPKPISGFSADLKTILTSTDSTAEGTARGIAQFLKRRNQWLIIFVDDMERVGPLELNKIFPVIDRLIDLDRCYFVFAIDPKRIAKALDDKPEVLDETTGYLDKILDLQVSLPNASNAEILELLQKSIEHEKREKLASVLPKLKDYLRLTPRQADRFLRDADARERMFLSRYGLYEENYEGFFLLLILEIRFPIAYNEFSRNGELRRELSTTGLFSTMEKENVRKEKIVSFVEKITSGRNDTQKTDLIHIIERISQLLALSGFTANEPKLDLDWAFLGYRKLIRFTLKERTAFIQIWAQHSGKLSVSEMLAEVGDFDEADLVVRQAFEMELEKVTQDLREAYQKEDCLLPSDCHTTAYKRIDRFVSHAEAILEGRFHNMDLDRKVFNRDLYVAWRKVLEEIPLRGLPDEFVKEVRRLIAGLTTSLAFLLEPKDQYEIATQGAASLGGAWINPENSNEIREVFSHLQKVIMDRFSASFVKLLTSKPIDEFYPQEWIEGMPWTGLQNPYIWLPRSAGDADAVLRDLVSEAKSNDVLRDNFIWIVRRDLLNAYYLSSNEAVREQESARDAIKQTPWYLEQCWKGAWIKPPSAREARLLTEILNRARAIEDSLDSGRSIAHILKRLSIPQRDPDQSNHEQ